MQLMVNVAYGVPIAAAFSSLAVFRMPRFLGSPLRHPAFCPSRTDFGRLIADRDFSVFELADYRAGCLVGLFLAVELVINNLVEPWLTLRARASRKRPSSSRQSFGLGFGEVSAFCWRPR